MFRVQISPGTIPRRKNASDNFANACLLALRKYFGGGDINPAVTQVGRAELSIVSRTVDGMSFDHRTPLTTALQAVTG